MSPQSIKAVISDVDGTLATPDKALTPATHAAVAALHARGIPFSIISSRPPRGLHAVIAALHITTPVCGFNGGIVTTPAGDVLERHTLIPDAAREVVTGITAKGVDVWLYTEDKWFANTPDNPRVPLERRTIQFDPIITKDFGEAFAGTYKIVAVSEDAAQLSACESDIRNRLGHVVTATRSQAYYLDITDHIANKATGVTALARQLNVPLEHVAVIGDGHNDVDMFGRAGFSIAMGNAAPEVREAATAETASNTDDGFAKAMKRFILSEPHR